jgi:TonB family protein
VASGKVGSGYLILDFTEPVHAHLYLIIYSIWASNSDLQGLATLDENKLSTLTVSIPMTAFSSFIYPGSEGLALDRTQGRTRKIEAGMISFLVHVALLSWGFLMIRQAETPLINRDALVFLNHPIILPFDGDGLNSGGGGGGGRNEPAPAATGRLPGMTQRQLISPDPDIPSPLLSPENLRVDITGIQPMIDTPQDELIPIGDISAPPNGSISFGPGSEGGIGTGHGPGIGPGNDLGAGPGSKGGWGGGPNGGPGHSNQLLVAGNGVKPPVPLLQPLPDYTNQARRARIEGVVLIQAVVRIDGAVDNIRVLRGLGYGLDESAISTIARKWRFKPATLNGTPVDVLANIEVSFRLF